MDVDTEIETSEQRMEELIIEPFMEDEIDFDYEFDAPRFYDFTEIELDWEASEADRWFDTAGGYLPSPLVVKLNWRQDIVVENKAQFKEDQDVNSNNCTNSEASSTSVPHEDISEANKNSKVKSTSSSSPAFMKPTVSLLAKQNQAKFVHSTRCLRRLQKVDRNHEKSSKNSSAIDNLTTKRQKLETGYLSKVAQLKHQALLLHKAPKKVGLDVISANSRPKVTTPKEPDLVTAHRAERHRYKTNAESGEQIKSNTHTFKARPLNRKILTAPFIPLFTRSKPPLTVFQEFRLKTLERALQHTASNAASIPGYSYISHRESIKTKRLNSINALKQQKNETIFNLKACTLNKKNLSRGDFRRDKTVRKEFKTLSQGRMAHEPPVDLLSKLSLTSEAQHVTKPGSKASMSAKGTKENTPGSINQEHEMINVVKERSQVFGGSKYNCGTYKKIPESQIHINRSWGIS